MNEFKGTPSSISVHVGGMVYDFTRIVRASIEKSSRQLTSSTYGHKQTWDEYTVTFMLEDCNIPKPTNKLLSQYTREELLDALIEETGG